MLAVRVNGLPHLKAGQSGEDRDIQIKEKSSLVRRGDKYDIAGVTCPSEEVKEKFLGIVRRKLR